MYILAYANTLSGRKHTSGRNLWNDVRPSSNCSGNFSSSGLSDSNSRFHIWLAVGYLRLSTIPLNALLSLSRSHSYSKLF